MTLAAVVAAARCEDAGLAKVPDGQRDSDCVISVIEVSRDQESGKSSLQVWLESTFATGRDTCIDTWTPLSVTHRYDSGRNLPPKLHNDQAYIVLSLRR